MIRTHRLWKDSFKDSLRQDSYSLIPKRQIKQVMLEYQTAGLEEAITVYSRVEGS